MSLVIILCHQSSGLCAITTGGSRDPDQEAEEEPGLRGDVRDRLRADRRVLQSEDDPWPSAGDRSLTAAASSSSFKICGVNLTKGVTSMSQYTFPVLAGTIEARVGWDPKFETYFAQVYMIDEEGEQVEEDEDGNDGMIFRVGTHHSAIRTVDHLERELRPHAKLPEEIRKELFKTEID